MNLVTKMMRECTNKYYKSWMVCEDPGCTGRTRVLPLKVVFQPGLEPRSGSTIVSLFDAVPAEKILNFFPQKK